MLRKCFPLGLLRAGEFTAGYVRLVGQEPPLSKCVLLSTSRAVRKDVKDWVSREGDKWTVKFDVRDLGGHLELPFVVGLLPWPPGFGWPFSIASSLCSSFGFFR